MKKSQGITLVSLVITVVIMLILAGVTISVFTGTDGMFSSITQATREYKKQAMLEAVDLAKAYVELDKTYTNEPITITDVIDKIKEVSTINEKDYIITVDDEEQTATIIDKATGVVVDIWIDENGHIQSDGNIVDDVENLVKPTVTYELDPPAGTYGDEVKITITAKEEKNGIVKTQFQNNAEKTYNNQKEVKETYTVTVNGTYTYTAIGANGRKANVYIEIKNIMNGADITLVAQETQPTNKPVNVVITYDENIKIGGATLINADRFQYSVGGTTWQTATQNPITVPVSINGKVYARYYDGTQGYKTTSLTITNIDKEVPVISSATASTSLGATNSVTIKATDAGSTGCAAGNIGIVGYGINQSNTTEPTYTPVTATTSLNTTINNITANGTYYVWVKDKAGNTANKAVTVNKVNTPIATVVSVGDYVNYDAGTWTEEDFNKITSSAGNPTVNKSASRPTKPGQFGGFTLGQSRNSNSTEFNNSYKPRTAGWRVWSIDENTGEVTLISAGHPETYYHDNDSAASVNILRNRDCSMYENSYAKAGSAHFLTGEEATRWYNKQYGTSYDESKCLDDLSKFSKAEPISVLENGSYYWFASASLYDVLYHVRPNERCVYSGSGVNYGGMRCSPPSFSTIWSPSRTRQWRRKRKKSMEINAIIKEFVGVCQV